LKGIQIPLIYDEIRNILWKDKANIDIIMFVVDYCSNEIIIIFIIYKLFILFLLYWRVVLFGLNPRIIKIRIAKYTI
jgi:hypothetical protein